MRTFILTVNLLACAGLVVAWGDDEPKKLMPEERKELEAKFVEHNETGFKAYQGARYLEAEKAWKDALGLARRLFPKTEFPDGHEYLAAILANLGGLYRSQGKLGEAESLYKEALDVRKRLFKGDHPDVAVSLNNLARLYLDQGKYSNAEPLFKEALDMRKRLFKGDHPSLAISLNGLAGLYLSQGRLSEAEPLCTDSVDMFRRLFKGDHTNVASSLTSLAALYKAQGKLVDAERLNKEALDMRKRLFKGDHPHVALSLNDLAMVFQAQGKLADAERLNKEALDMRKRLFKGDHTDLARSLNNLAALYKAQGKLADAEPLLKESLDMSRRLFKGDHPDLAMTLNNLAMVYESQGKPSEADRYLKESLDMSRRLFKGDHPDLAMTLNNLAGVYYGREKLSDAEPFFKEALDMRRRLFEGDHPYLALSLNNLAGVYRAQGRLSDAEPFFKEALDMRRRLVKGDHPDLALSLNNLAALYKAQGKPAEAEPLLKDALDMYKRLIIADAKQKSEGEALTYLATHPAARDALLSVVRLRELNGKQPYDPATTYPTLWSAKGFVARLFEQRQLQARAVTDPAVAKMLAEQVDARRRRAELIYAPPTKDPGTLKAREADIKKYDDIIAKLNETLPKQLPEVARIDKLDNAKFSELQKLLPADAAMVDYFHYKFFEFDNSKPVGKKETRTRRYLAFVVTRDKVAWVDLDTAANIEDAITAWRRAITGVPERKIDPASIEETAKQGKRVRELVWEKVRKELPAAIKTVYICPDATLCKLPFAALPGDKPNTILLEDFAIASIPHAPFLLDKLWKQDPLKNPPTTALAVGGVKYDAELAVPAPNPNATATRGEPLLNPGQEFSWDPLKHTMAEAKGFANAANRQKDLTAVALDGDKATTSAVLAALPKAKYAHFATHGFFSDPSFRNSFQLDEKEYRHETWGERVGKVANNPMLMTGLVLARANNPKTPGRGILTGDQLIDLDLSGLELAVLSACETGLGDVAGGEGVYGLQRAFHYAGTQNVVASLWKVPDAATAALMGEFYRQLWDEKKPPIEALRQAQLAVYRANTEQLTAMALRYGKGDNKPPVIQEGPAKTTRKTDHPMYWAAFSLSGLGR